MRGAFIIAMAVCAALPASAGPYMPMGVPSLVKPLGGQQNEYVATFAAPVQIPGAVNAGGIIWKCGHNECSTTGPWPVPGVGSCNALALQEGYVTSYGYSAAQLTQDQLASCNKGVASNVPPPKPMGMNPYQGFKPQMQLPPQNPQGSKDTGMTPPPDKSMGMKMPPAGPPYDIRTVTFEATGTGMLADRLPFSPVSIRTAPFEVSGAPVTASAFSPVTIRTQTFTVSGTGSP